MLAPIRDYLSPQDPQSSSLLCATRDRYFGSLSVVVDPNRPVFEGARWIASEDLNVEHLLDVFISIDKNTGDVWDVCYHFLQHLVWHKPRQTVLRQRVESLPDSHPYKPNCLSMLSLLFQQIGNKGERKKLVDALGLQRQRGDDHQVARTVMLLSDVNRLLGLFVEGIEQAREALTIHERIGDTIGQGQCLDSLTWLLFDDKQLDAAENAASRAVNLLSDKGQDHIIVGLHRVICKIHHSKGRKERAIHHLNTAIEIASLRDWHDQLFWIYFDMTLLFRDECKYDDANAQIKQAQSHAGNDLYKLGRTMQLQAGVWFHQDRLEDAKYEAVHALENYEEAGAAYDAEVCRGIIQDIERGKENRLLASG